MIISGNYSEYRAFALSLRKVGRKKLNPADFSTGFRFCRSMELPGTFLTKHQKRSINLAVSRLSLPWKKIYAKKLNPADFSTGFRSVTRD